MSQPNPNPVTMPRAGITYTIPGVHEEEVHLPLAREGKASMWAGTLLVYPKLTGRSVCVLPGAFSSSIVELFVEGGCRFEGDHTKADFVVFSGGVDVNPALYGEMKLGVTQTPNSARDNFEREVFDHCLQNGKPMIGICRGAQFLHVMNDGKLWQHVSGHAGGDHLMLDHELNVLCDTTSLHHQQLRYNPNMEVVAVCASRKTSVFMSADVTYDGSLKTAYVGDGDKTHKPMPLDKHYMEIEAGKYPLSKCWFTQGHPEIGSKTYRGWFMFKVNQFIEEVDFGW